MNYVVYEHPLNERVRLLMRLELIFSLLNQHQDVSKQSNIQPLLQTLFQAIEILERNDVRQTLAFYLDLFEKNMVRWSAHPDVANDSLQAKLAQSVHLQTELNEMTKACQQLKDDKFLASLRQRFGIAGGACDFDLPQLHYWRHKPEQQRVDDVSHWLSSFKPLMQALDFCMLFIRQSSEFKPCVAENGFYQASGVENAHLIRVRYDVSLSTFPMVSGSRHRYSVTFMLPSVNSVKTTNSDNINFEIAIC